MNNIRSLGIDPGSKNAGISVVEDDLLLHSEQWTTGLGKDFTTEDLGKSLFWFKERLLEVYYDYEPTIVVVELCSVPINFHTNKLLAYFEASSIMAAYHAAILCERVRTTQARAKVIGKNCKKPEAVAWVKNLYGKDLKEDQAESIIFALYGTKILEHVL